MTLFNENEIAPDERDVLEVSAILQITEFHLFELAHQRWFGEAVSEAEIEHFFNAYMFDSVVPYWVRQYCREVLRSDREGGLDPTVFGVFPLEENDTLFQRGIRYILLVIFVMVAFHGLAFLATN